MRKRPIPLEAEITRLVGHRFPGGSYTVAHWENFLLTQCTGAELLCDGQVHPVALFHLPITGAGTSIAEMFELGQAESDLSIMIESYDWEMFLPLQEDTCYSVSGGINGAQRCTNPEGKLYDRIVFCFEVHTPENILAARTTITWHYTRDTL
ncbi:Uncharacterised protein [Halioglobus japonicus]|nr:Uncharacterised protein [Halioglobus japonicus]